MDYVCICIAPKSGFCDRCYGREYRKTRLLENREHQRIWRKRNPKRKAAIAKKWRLANVEKMKVTRKKWRQSHRDAEAAMKHRRRAKLLGLGGSYTAFEWQLLKERCNNCCVCCLRNEVELAILGLKLVPDHIIPIAKGGRNYIANIQPLCHNNKCKNVAGCNEYKNDSIVDYREVIGM
jgi:hypothetical protein